jgi:hypothetical protein
MVQIFCEVFKETDATLALRNFHLAAFFVCVKQFCLMRQIGQERWAQHYLQRASESASQISAEEAVSLVAALQFVK